MMLNHQIIQTRSVCQRKAFMAKGLKKNLINDATIELLSKFEILRDLSKDELKKLLRGKETDYEARLAKLIRYNPNETVIQEGDFDSWSFWIVTGTYSIVIAGTAIATLSTPGDIFGEMSVLEGIPRTASVISVGEGICLGIDMSILGTIDDEYLIHAITSGFKQKKLRRLNITHSQLLKDKQETDARYTSILQLEQNLRETEANLKETEATLKKTEIDLKKAEADLSSREEAIRKKEQELITREAALSSIDTEHPSS